MSRWTFSTLDDSEVYHFPISPNAQTSPIQTAGHTWSWSPVAQRYTAVPVTRTLLSWSFSGVLHDQDHYTALGSWCARGTRIKVTTDLGEVLTVRLTQFVPSRKGPQRRRHPWRHQYTVKALLFSYEAPDA